MPSHGTSRGLEISLYANIPTRVDRSNASPDVYRSVTTACAAGAGAAAAGGGIAEIAVANAFKAFVNACAWAASIALCCLRRDRSSRSDAVMIDEVLAPLDYSLSGLIFFFRRQVLASLSVIRKILSPTIFLMVEV